MPPAPKKKAPAQKVAAKKAPVKKAAPRKRAGLPPEIVPIGAGNVEHPRILVYGEPGTGKTVLLGSAPNSLMLEADQGDASAAIQGSTAQKWPLRDWDDAAHALEWLQHGGTKEFEFLTFDTITMFQDSGLANIMEDLVALKPNRKLWLPDKGEYGQNMNRLIRFIKDLIRLPIPIIASAHIQQDQDHEGETRYMPYVQGKNMPDKVCSFFDVVAHMQMRVKDGKEIPRLSTLKEGKYYTKDRYGSILALADPTVPKIMTRIERGPQG
jgi:hypothetical protein